MNTQKFGLYILSLMILGATQAHAVSGPCWWANEDAAQREVQHRNAANAAQARLASLNQAQAQNQKDLTLDTASQIEKDKANKNIANLISRLQMFVLGLAHLEQDFAADEKGRAALASFVSGTNPADWVSDVKTQIDELEMTDGLRNSIVGLLSAFSEPTPDPRIRLQDAGVALEGALSAPDLAGASTGIEITRRTANLRIQEATSLFQGTRDALGSADAALAKAQADSVQLAESIQQTSQEVTNEINAMNAAAGQKGTRYCDPPPTRPNIR